MPSGCSSACSASRKKTAWNGSARNRRAEMADWILAVCIAIGAVVYLDADSKLPQLQVGDPMGPQVFPALIGIGLLGSALLLMVETWRKHRAAAEPRPDPDLGSKEARAHRLILAGMVLWTALYYLAFEPLGYLL